MERPRPMSLKDLTMANLDKPQWAEFAKRYQTPEPTPRHLEVDSENPVMGHEGRTIFSPDTCEGARE